MALKSKNTTKKTEPEKTAKKSGTSAIDKQIADKRAEIETLQGELKALLAKKLNQKLGDIKVGDTIYYPAPPQKNIIACKLEIEEDGKGEIVYFARPICKTKDGKEVLSKRHYSLGTDLSDCKDLYKEPPKSAKKNSAKATAKPSKTSATVDKSVKPSKKTEKSDKPKLGAKKAKLGKKK